MDQYKIEQKKLWDQWTEIHLRSDFYDVEAVIRGKDTLNSIESDGIGNVKGKSILHLQCHFGLDSISLSRRGARVTAVDLSGRSIEEARKLARSCGQEITFLCSDIYEVNNILNNKFDMVFTSYGAIIWLPDLSKWGRIISEVLKPGGIFYMAEFHPLYYMLDDNNREIVRYPWDSKGDPLVFKNVSSYADPSIDQENIEYCWAHGIATVIQAITSNNLKLEYFNEYDYSPYRLSDDMIQVNPDQWRFKDLKDKIPYVFSLKATR